MNYIPNKNGKVLLETLAASNSDAVKATLKRLRHFKMTLPLQVLQKSLSFFCHFVTHNRQYYK